MRLLEEALDEAEAMHGEPPAEVKQGLDALDDIVSETLDAYQEAGKPKKIEPEKECEREIVSEWKREGALPLGELNDEEMAHIGQERYMEMYEVSLTRIFLTF